jgi:hypothetical protein
MPQETKSMPAVEHKSLQGWIPALASDDEIRAALEKAFDFRGDITVTLKDQTRVEGYVFDRRAEGPQLSACLVRILPKDSDQRVAIRYDQIARLEFSGRDCAEGKSFETWVRKYNEKKAAGEKNIRIDPEKLD